MDHSTSINIDMADLKGNKAEIFAIGLVISEDDAYIDVLSSFTSINGQVQLNGVHRIVKSAITDEEEWKDIGLLGKQMQSIVVPEDAVANHPETG